MEQVSQKNNKIKFTVIFILILFTKQSVSQSFNPSVKEFCAYIHHIYGNGVSLSFISTNKKAVIDFKYDSTTSSFYFTDTSIVVVFYATHYPSRLDTLYHFVDWFNFYLTAPLTKERTNKIYRNKYSEYKYNGWVTKQKIRFTAYSYENYKSVEKQYGALSSFGIYGKVFTEPSMIKSSNEYYIINYFYPKPLRYCK